MDKSDYRCPFCGKLLFKGSWENGRGEIEVKCSRCGHRVSLNVKPSEEKEL